MNKFLDSVTEQQKKFSELCNHGLLAVYDNYVQLTHEKFLQLFKDYTKKKTKFGDLRISTMYNGIEFMALVTESELEQWTFEINIRERCDYEHQKEVDAFWNDVEAGIKEEV